ncbi:hypothetical protein PPM_p0199 (plasmid) [Paenibacillus polymyxa M1]|uniref:hypothetical protein n=1 Tax=Paenibacillus polymyxa TaxID=1406 RepID=UPI00021BBBB3|nr:hypothetical protein [Paenibacillus polymyxa]CCC86349.1 hypothetical protein PPM_p0199 [Paenibacillus polymyxa M1]
MSQNQGIKSVTLSLEVTVQVNGDDVEQLLAAAKLKVAEKIQNDFPSYFKYSITDGIALSLEKAYPGKIVFIPNLKKHGVICSINKSSYSVITPQGRINCKLPALTDGELAIEELLLFASRDKNLKSEWSEGNVGFLRYKDDYVPVILGREKNGKTPAYRINGSERYNLTDIQLKKHLFDAIPVSPE